MLVTSKMCMVKDVGMNGNLFGGNMLAFMDEAAAIFAHQRTGEESMVTAWFGEISFKRPVKVGDIVEFYCNNEVIGNTSIKFDIHASVSNNTVFETKCVFVAQDENGNKKIIEKE